MANPINEEIYLSQLVYKYRDYDLRALEIIISKQLWLAEPSTLNDPFDCQVEYSQAFEAAISHLQLSAEAIKSFSRASTDVVKNLRVLSLSKTAENPLLWAHYANSHKGVCLGFNPQYLSGWHNPQLRPQDVKYSNESPILEFPRYLMESDFKDPKHRSNLVFILEEFLHQLALTKPKIWEVEEEIRVVTKHPMQGKSISFLPIALEEVVFGLNMSPQAQLTIRGLFTESQWHHVNFFKMTKSAGSFVIKKELI
ncbi:hypothetical protein BIY21_08570 [Vibrio ponticus]|uniref:DUF2971 domain-containing protein n=1 Tax=Vibrio ponticus TaxID=265668 RepID=A0ABX3FP62_9VIBR|nr:DUF2971 domain-containing protein [Vibrio ponticus]OLQ94528.1 hypothetical protein BIY21_08570 [Vibrio ponticus]